MTGVVKLKGDRFILLTFGLNFIKTLFMPRTSRVVLPNYPHHIIQRGHNKQVIFISNKDYLYYLDTLHEWKKNLGCKVYAYCLMTNHVHLIINPEEKVENLGLLMKRVAGRYTRYRNGLEGRSGTLWESRYKSSPIQKDEYLLACCRYIELNPVRAGIVEAPEKYRWSSYPYKGGSSKSNWLDLNPHLEALGAKRYKEFVNVKDATSEGEWDLIRKAVQRGQLTGSERFVKEVEEMIGRRIELRGQGRPKEK